MCNACGNLCCGSDQFEACGCEDCTNPACHSACPLCDEFGCDLDCDGLDEDKDYEITHGFYPPGIHACPRDEAPHPTAFLVSWKNQEAHL